METTLLMMIFVLMLALGLLGYHNQVLAKENRALRSRYVDKIGELVDERSCRVAAESQARKSGFDYSDGHMVDLSSWPLTEQLRHHAKTLTQKVGHDAGAS